MRRFQILKLFLRILYLVLIIGHLLIKLLDLFCQLYLFVDQLILNLFSTFLFVFHLLFKISDGCLSDEILILEIVDLFWSLII